MDIALDDVALYLINHGYGDDKDKAKLLCRASGQNKLDIVKELVEEHKLDPNGKYLYTCVHVFFFIHVYYLAFSSVSWWFSYPDSL